MFTCIQSGNLSGLRAAVRRIVKNNRAGLDQLHNGQTAVMQSVQSRKKDCLRQLIKSGANVNVTGEGKCLPLCTAIQAAVQEHDLDYLQQLCRAGSPVDSSDDCQVPLCVAASGPGHTELIKLLLELGADPNKCNGDSNTPLIIAAGGGLEYVRLLLAGGACPNVSNCNGVCPLYVAAQAGQTEIIHALASAGADMTGIISSLMETGTTALCICALEGHSSSVEALIKRGAQIDEPCKDGWTALAGAVQEGHLETVRVLLSHGALTTCEPAPLLHLAVLTRNIEMLKLLLEHMDPDTDLDEYEMTPLHLCCESDRRGTLPLMKVLLEKGASVHTRDLWGRTPLMFPFRRATAQALLDAGASVLDVDEDGNSPLHTAVMNGSGGPLISTLIAAGADLAWRNSDGVTAEDIAYENQHSFAELLINRARKVARKAARKAARMEAAEKVVLPCT